MRETVAKEIAAFRDRSNRRDMERLKREEEIEALERQKKSQVSHGQVALASPPPAAPSGPAGGANGIPDRSTETEVFSNAPSGSKGIPGLAASDETTKKAVRVRQWRMVVNGASAGLIHDREDEDSDASDEELEKRRKEEEGGRAWKSYIWIRSADG